jgi:glutamyl-Q tRNA(Asp) synthetase
MNLHSRLNPADSASSTYTGRFAPSPTGELHFGSLVAAVASFLQARCNNGKWLIRMEDIDPPRELAGSASGILRDLLAFAMKADEDVLFQSQRIDAYEQACRHLLAVNQAFWCGCSRKDLPSSGVYPGTCRNGIKKGKSPRAIRVKVATDAIEFSDRLQGKVVDPLQSSVGDFVIRRADGLFAYQLAVVVDDAFQNITQVVRGADLLDSTARQIHLQNCLDLPVPDYAHVPLAVLSDGSKLGKRVASDPIHSGSPHKALQAALAFLGHNAPDLSLTDTWQWALANWSLDKVPHQMTAPAA